MAQIIGATLGAIISPWGLTICLILAFIRPASYRIAAAIVGGILGGGYAHTRALRVSEWLGTAPASSWIGDILKMTIGLVIFALVISGIFAIAAPKWNHRSPKK